jgi:hypothetical protein
MHHRLNSLLLLVLLSASLPVMAQPGTPSSGYSRIDRHALESPAEASQSVEALAGYLSSASSRPREKYRAIYIWIAHHIAYDEAADLESLIASRQFNESQQPEAVLQQRKAVCQGYAQLAKALSDAMGLTTEVISGLVRNEEGQVERLGHAWIAFRAGTEWYLSDPTWGATPGAGMVNQQNEDYFLVAPEAFIEEHLPLDPIWQLTPAPLTYQEFATLPREELGPRFNRRARKPFVFQDSIRQHLRLDTLQQPVQAAERMLRYNGEHPNVLFRVGNIMYAHALAIASALEDELTASYNEGARPVSEAKFKREMAAFERYCQIVADCFERIREEELRAALEKRQPQFTAEVLQRYLPGLFHAQHTRKLMGGKLDGPSKLDAMEGPGSQAIHFFRQAAAMVATGAPGQELAEMSCPLRRQIKSLRYNLALAARDALADDQGPPGAAALSRAQESALRGLNHLYAASDLLDSLATEGCLPPEQAATEKGNHLRLAFSIRAMLNRQELAAVQSRLVEETEWEAQTIQAMEEAIGGLLAQARQSFEGLSPYLAEDERGSFLYNRGAFEAQALYALGIASYRRCGLAKEDRAALEQQARQSQHYFLQAAELARQTDAGRLGGLIQACQTQIEQLNSLLARLRR